jgi:response regulator RpfG family c-di-GMP phosphodiesterase
MEAQNQNRIMNELLLIDDDSITNFLHEAIIRKAEICKHISKKHNGEEAMEYLKELAANCQPFPQLIFLDLNMPVMDGFEFLESVNEVFPHLLARIYIVSTSSYPKDLDRVKKYNIHEIIQKPLNTTSVNRIAGKFRNTIENVASMDNT